MEIKEFTFRLLLLGLPGICCYFLLKKLVGKIGADITEAILSIFVLSLLCYFATDLARFLPRIICLLPWEAPFPSFGLIKSLYGDSGKVVAPYAVLATTIFSAPAVAAVLSLFVRYKIWNRLCQTIGVTHRFGDEDLFNLFLEADQGPKWYVVRDHKEDLVYYGAITHCSDEGNDRELILQNVGVYSNEGAADFLYDCPSLYICRNRDDISIEIIGEAGEKKATDGVAKVTDSDRLPDQSDDNEYRPEI